MSLWLCLRFNQLPLQCLDRDEQQPVVVLAAQRVICANDCASALGIQPGMGSATVRALAADESVRLLERDEQAEQSCMHQLCSWAYGITPTLCTWQEHCLQLEIGGCLTLFRGLQPLLAEITRGVSSKGFSMLQGLAPTPKAAWLLSFADKGSAMAIDQALEERLAPLPLNHLAPVTQGVDSLRRAGLHTLGDVLALPPASVGRRCGKAFTDFLQQLLGQQDDLQVSFTPPASFTDTVWFGYEVKTCDELLPAVQQLLQSLCHFLRNTQLRTSEITWQLVGVDHTLLDLQVRSASSHSDWENWYQLSCIHFARLQLTNGVEGLNLDCLDLQPGQQESIDLFSPRNQREPLAALLDRLRNRLGLQAIETVDCRDEHLPEFSVQVGNELAGRRPGPRNRSVQRPFWLMPQPLPLRQQGESLYWKGVLTLHYGPERIEDNWWRQAVSRDYYIAADAAGQQYWLFRDRLERRWYIHGVFA